MLWKFYLVTLERIVFNYCDKHIVPALLPGIETDQCRNLTVCSPVFISGIDLSQILAKISCQAVKNHYMLEVFSTY